MPNYVSMYVEVAGEPELIAKMKEECQSKQLEFDFDKVVPQPTSKGDCNREFRMEETDGDIEPYPERPWFNWYKWCNRYWGTKWNACEPFWDNNTLYLMTAWDCPVPVFEALAKKYRELMFKVVYADEDYGYNCGILFFKEGELFRKLKPTGGSKGAKLIAKSVLGER